MNEYRLHSATMVWRASRQHAYAILDVPKLLHAFVQSAGSSREPCRSNQQDRMAEGKGACRITALWRTCAHMQGSTGSQRQAVCQRTAAEPAPVS